jgi:hypothetical protein
MKWLMIKKYGMKRVIDFIIKQELDLNDYPTLLEPLKANFNIKDKEGNEATKELLDTVIWWENNTGIIKSLEKL